MKSSEACAFELLLGVVVACDATDSHCAEPNFVFILADDQGWTALSTRMDPDRAESKSDYYQTPNLDRLSREGMRFSQAYAPSSTCAPTRHSIQFGMSPARLRFVAAKESRTLTVEPEDALVNHIKASHPEYVFAHFGKWHIWFSPEDLGYDESDGSTGNDEGNVGVSRYDPKRIFAPSHYAVCAESRPASRDRPPPDP